MSYDVVGQVPQLHVAGGPRVRVGHDISPDVNGMVHPPSVDDLANLQVSGLSTYDTVENLTNTGLSGQVRVPHRPLPDGLGVVEDHVGVGGSQPLGHHTVYPTRSMPLAEYEKLIKGMDWQNIGINLKK